MAKAKTPESAEPQAPATSNDAPPEAATPNPVEEQAQAASKDEAKDDAKAEDAGAKKDSAEQVKGAPKERDTTAEVLKAYAKIDQAELAKRIPGFTGLPSLAADQIRTPRIDAEGAIIAVTDHGQKLVVSDGVCTITTGPGYVPEGPILGPVE